MMRLTSTWSWEPIDLVTIPPRSVVTFSVADLEAGTCPEDLDLDGVVGISDVLLLLGEFGCVSSAQETLTAMVQSMLRTCCR